MTNPTYGKPLVPPADILARLDALIPRSIAGEPLLWVARAVATPVLIEAHAEIERLRARVAVLERVREAAEAWTEDMTMPTETLRPGAVGRRLINALKEAKP